MKNATTRAATAPGFRDIAGADLEMRNAMTARILNVYRRWGYAPIETPAIERAECLGSQLPDMDRPNAGVFAWENLEDGVPLALRYDLTAPLARYVAQNIADLPMPFRRAAAGPVWRNEKVAPGRYREFWQCDADLVGVPSIGADAELCVMLGEALIAAGLSPEDGVIRVSNRKLLDGVLEACGVDTLSEKARMTALRAIDKIDRLGDAGVRDLLGPGRRDESGAFTTGANLSSGQVDWVMSFLAADLSDLRALVGASVIGQQGVQQLEALLDLTAAMNPEMPVRFDPSIVRGLGYYTGTVLEADLTFEIQDETGQTRRFGSVAGGGRYDDLIREFVKRDVPAIGVSIGVDRLVSALKLRIPDAGTPRRDRPVLVTVMDRDAMATYQAMAGDLRRAGVNAQVYYGNPKKFGAQLKYADRIGASLAVIQGGDERSAGRVTLKDLDLGRRLAATASVEDWAARPQQRDVDAADLVSEVVAMIS